ncbi:hypothetical protein STU22816_16730 [Edwardsiella ictaluri]|nr:hypothetical protein KH20906_16510 [Edwardsiella ictaluri]BEI12820.1 hypothetical protein STU22816_16730 [Edwardsiella ictaluri]BEI19780.1 hypothetical protein STH22820_16800 [Edwardsiella ictaluri]
MPILNMSKTLITLKLLKEAMSCAAGVKSSTGAIAGHVSPMGAVAAAAGGVVIADSH